jgi:hypothetical protein
MNTSNRYEHVKEASAGLFGADQQRIAEVGLDWLVTILRKNRNYGSSVWKSPALSPSLPVLSAILVRMSDKVSRIAALMSGTQDEVGESLNDTIQDLGAYCLLYLAYRPEKEDAPGILETGFFEKANELLDEVAEDAKIWSTDPYSQYPYVATAYDKDRTDAITKEA